MTFRVTVGTFCLIAGAIFLAINSTILYLGAGKWASTEHEKMLFGVAAATVPWVIAVLPALLTDSWKRVRIWFFSIVLPTSGTLKVSLVWVAFIAYNIIGGSGSIGLNRQALMAQREHSGDVLKGIKGQLASKKRELEGVPQHRPAETIERETDALQTAKIYKLSGECDKPRNERERTHCQTILRLEGELGAARKGEKLQAEIAALEERLASFDPTASANASDPQAELIHDATGIDRERVQTWLPAATPIILEVGAATMWGFAFSILGWGLGSAARSRQQAEEAIAPVALIPSPQKLKTAPVTSLAALTAQRKLCDWFFSNCARPVASGAMTEAEWFEHYSTVCRRSSDVPLPLEAFRRIASNYLPRIESIDGVTYYFEALPVIPENA